MAGDGEDGRMYALLFIILCLCGWLSFDGGADFNKGCDCLQSETTREQQRSMIIAVMNAIYAIAYRSLKKSTGFEPVTSRYRCDALTN